MNQEIRAIEVDVPADLAALGPMDALSRLAGEVALLHSASGEGLSVLAFDPLRTLETHDPAALSLLEAQVREAPFDSPHPLTGWIGFISYDIGAVIEDIGRQFAGNHGWPLVRFVLFRHYLVFDRTSSRLRAFVVGEQTPPAWDRLRRPPMTTPHHGSPQLIEQQSRSSYLEKVRQVKEFIASGDIYQANLAQRWAVASSESPVEIFRRLCEASPAPYAAFLRFGEASHQRHVLSASPELFLTVEEGRVITRPIKGTRRRDTDSQKDQQLREELVASEKDCAELAMIVDLLRNDLGRVSTFGTVQVLEPRVVEQHPTVWHTVATITSTLRQDVGIASLLTAVCPGGSITGAPKIRAMQIIEKLEGFRRELYCGNIGIIGARGSTLALNIAIRTILMEQNVAYLYAGGGIVADSDPNAEYEETLHKAAALFRALGLKANDKGTPT